MIRLCTHCKKADTEDLEFKYCTDCLVKLRDWLDRNAKTEPLSVVPTKEDAALGKNLEQLRAYNLYKGKKDV